jgi:hypothetical protein
MKKIIEYLVVFVSAVLIVTVIGLLISLPVMWLWNAVVPSIFHLREITWIEAWLLNTLTHILFGNSFYVNKKNS